MRTLRRPHRPTERDIAALADGSLPARRHGWVERAIAAKPGLEADLRAQRAALAALRVLEDERAPAALRARVALAPPPRRAARRIAAPALAGAAALAATVVLTFGGSAAAGPSVADAAALATRPPAASVPAASPSAATLPRPRGAGLPFPNWRQRFGWTATGTRRDRIGGRGATTVFYRRGAELAAYTIVTGSPLRVGTRAQLAVRAGIALRSLTTHGRRIVTWLRDGRTCVLSSTAADRATLLRLAAGERP